MGGRLIAGIYERYDRLSKRRKDIYNKNLYYRGLVEKLISDNYGKFTVEEKKNLLVDSKKYNVASIQTENTPDIFEIKGEYNEKLIENIDLKTNYLYSKYMGMLKLTYNQISMVDSGYDLKVKSNYIKRIKFDK